MMADLHIDIGSIWMDIADDDDIVQYLAVGKTALSIHMSEKEFGHLEHYVRLLREHLDKHRGEDPLEYEGTWMGSRGEDFLEYEGLHPSCPVCGKRMDIRNLADLCLTEDETAEAEASWQCGCGYRGTGLVVYHKPVSRIWKE